MNQLDHTAEANISGNLIQTGGELLSWLVRDHCDRNHAAVVDAWEKLASEPTVADCGRMLAAYGRDFTQAELAYIGSTPQALQFARYVAGGDRHIVFQEGEGYVGRGKFAVPREGKLSALLIVFGVLTMACAIAGAISLLIGKTNQAVGCGLISLILLLLSVIEFVDLRGQHYARRAIELSHRILAVKRDILTNKEGTQ